jgi:hypothetical protein
MLQHLSGVIRARRAFPRAKVVGGVVALAVGSSLAGAVLSGPPAASGAVHAGDVGWDVVVGPGVSGHAAAL